MPLSKSNRSPRMQSLGRVDESRKFLERKGCRRGCHWHLEMLAFIFKTFTSEGKKIHTSKEKAL